LIGMTIDYINCYADKKYTNNYINEMNEMAILCVQYLIGERLNMYVKNGKYIALYSFITTYLNIPDNGYPYVIMQWLENKKILDHGSGIRCGWLNWDYDKDRMFDLAKNEKVIIDMSDDMLNKNIIDQINSSINNKIDGWSNIIMCNSIVIKNIGKTCCIIKYTKREEEEAGYILEPSNTHYLHSNYDDLTSITINGICKIETTLRLLNKKACDKLDDIAAVMNA
jgi:hypothetical protein